MLLILYLLRRGVKNMKKILLSVLTIGAVAALAFGASRAFFSDVETSIGNIFEAGDLDLQIDSTAHYAGLICTPGTEGATWQPEVDQVTSRPDLVDDPCGGTWPAKDLVNEKFFNLSDLKPGDEGENTISIHANSNDQYVCAAIYNLEDLENTFLDAELDDGDTGVPVGELSGEVNFFAWADDGDNIWQAEELPLFADPFVGPAIDVLGGVVYPLFTTPATVLSENETQNIGLYWCFGTIDASVPGTLTCNGSAVDNTSQTDSFTADMAFYAEQARNNEDFRCPDISTFLPPVAPAPSIDGIISQGEYDGDNVLTMLITDTGGGTVKAKTQGGYLYLAADILSDTTDNRSCCGFNDEFGVNLGESPTTDTVFFGLGSTNANGRTFGPTDGLWSNFDPTGHTIMSLFGTGHRVIEWKIPLTSIPGIVNGDTLSIGGATESTDGNSAVYPIGLVWGNNATYGQLLVTP
jgi:predicted ribosomally synthesized peptide with SipW-like signal peptide